MLLSAARKKPAIGLTPLIDVVFILLIFFMLVMQFQQFQQNPISLTKSAKRSVTPSTANKVTVQDSGQCMWQTRLVECQQLITQFSASDSTVLLGYTDAVTLQQLMHWHDQFVAGGIHTSLAVNTASTVGVSRTDNNEAP